MTLCRVATWPGRSYNGYVVRLWHIRDTPYSRAVRGDKLRTVFCCLGPRCGELGWRGSGIKKALEWGCDPWRVAATAFAS